MRTILALAILLLIPAGGVFAVETIPSFDAVITVHANATIDVVERIRYDFGTEERHGIFRTIPYSYQAGTETYTADIVSVIVADEAGVPRPFNESRSNGSLTLKIGDPNTTVTGTHGYVISYTVQGPFLYFDEYDEFYWNVTGAWEKSIASSSVLINLPPGAQVINASCYQGSSRETTSCDNDEKLVSPERAGYFASAYNLAPGEGFTVAVSFPKGTIALVEKPWSGRGSQNRFAYTPLAIPLFVLILLGNMWYKRGRDPKGRSTIVPEYTPPEGISPAVAGIVYNERIEPREISAEIVRLAVEGHIRIHRIEKPVLIFTTTDYLLERTATGEPGDEVGRTILEKLFKPEYAGSAEVEGKTIQGTLVSKMRHSFAKDRDDIIGVLYNDVLDRGFFVERPDTVRKRYLGVTIVLFVAGGIIFANASTLLANVFAIAHVVSGVFVGIWSWFMPARTAEGVRIKEHLEGFKRYLDVAEKDRLAFHNSPRPGVGAPALNAKSFDAYLPYAMAFGVEKAWAKQFEGMHTEQPSWYTGTNGAFSVGAFTSDMSSFAVDFTTASAPASSGSSGGGSVGGGFGGGGGGSW